MIMRDSIISPTASPTEYRPRYSSRIEPGLELLPFTCQPGSDSVAMHSC